MRSRNALIINLPVFLAMVFWSFSFIWYKQVFKYYDPVTVIVLRLVFAVPLLFILSLAAGKLQRISRKHFKWFVLLGCVLVSLTLEGIWADMLNILSV